MKQKNYTLDLRKYIDGPNPYGTSRGRKAHALLVEDIDAHLGASVIGISLANIEAADVSFFRECVIYAVKRYSKQIAFFVFGITDEDLIDNLHGAAISGDQRLTCWVGNECRFVGPEPSTSGRALLDLIINSHKTTTTTAEVAVALGISVQNASTRLKRLTDEGFLLRTEASADSGGKEFVYQIIGKSA